MAERTDKIVRLHLDTCNRLEAIRTYPRETIDDLVNKALNSLDIFCEGVDNKMQWNTPEERKATSESSPSKSDKEQG